jgi:CheY-like chemotaxis protein
MMNTAVLYVEDEEADAILLRACFQRAGITNPLLVVTDGKKAMEYLAGENGYSDRERFPFPCLVLLDIKLPRVSGLEVLRWMRQGDQPQLKHLPVLMFTSSDCPQDINAAYALGANGYLIKLATHEQLEDRANAIKQFWLVHNTPPLSCLQAAGEPFVSGKNHWGV